MKLAYYLIIPSLLFSFSVFAQVDIDKSINLTGGVSDARVKGIKSVSDSLDAANAKSVQSGSLVYGGTSSFAANTYSISLSPRLRLIPRV